jgi:hypothetical protein
MNATSINGTAWGTKLSANELERRKPVWTAVSELWLDVHLDTSDLQRIAQVLTASGYSMNELDDIYLYEVAPVVSSNLRLPAGVWDGFDPNWLHPQTQRRAERRGAWLRFCIAIGIGRSWLTGGTRKQWNEVRRLIGSRS